MLGTDQHVESPLLRVWLPRRPPVHGEGGEGKHHERGDAPNHDERTPRQHAALPDPDPQQLDTGAGQDHALRDAPCDAFWHPHAVASPQS